MDRVWTGKDCLPTQQAAWVGGGRAISCCRRRLLSSPHVPCSRYSCGSAHAHALPLAGVVQSGLHGHPSLHEPCGPWQQAALLGLCLCWLGAGPVVTDGKGAAGTGLASALGRGCRCYFEAMLQRLFWWQGVCLVVGWGFQACMCCYAPNKQGQPG